MVSNTLNQYLCSKVQWRKKSTSELHSKRVVNGDGGKLKREGKSIMNFINNEEEGSLISIGMRYKFNTYFNPERYNELNTTGDKLL